MTTAIVCYSRKRAAWVIYDRPTRRDALRHAASTRETQWDAVERQSITGSLPLAWPARPDGYASMAAAEAAAMRGNANG